MSGVYGYMRILCNVPAPTQKLGDRFASNVLSSSLLMVLSCSRDAEICASALIVSVLNSLETKGCSVVIKGCRSNKGERRKEEDKGKQSIRAGYFKESLSNA